MANREELYDRIERYLRNELPADERADFEAQLATDAELKAELELHRGIERSVNDTTGSLLEDALTAVGNEYKAEPAIEAKHRPDEKLDYDTYKQSMGWLQQAATVLAIVGAGLVLWVLTSQQTDSQALFAEQFAPYPTHSTLRSSETAADTQRKTAMQAYRAGDYQTALDGLSALTEPETADRFYLGNCQLALELPKASIVSFQSVMTANDPLYTEQAEWYLALAHLADDSPEGARVVLKNIQPGHAFYDKAAALLQELPKD